MALRGGSLRVSIVGAGRVGSALALLFRSKGIRVVSVVSKRVSSARQAASLAGCRRFSNKLSDIHPETNFLLLALPDHEVKRVAQQIAVTANLDFRKLACAHTSGMLTSDELRPLARLGATVCSMHPIQSFPGGLTRQQQLHALKGISYGVEGSPKAQRYARRLVHRLGGRMLRVPKEKKILYHVACVVASNYSIALLGVVEELAGAVSSTAPVTHLSKLIESSIQNAFQSSPSRALTGPIARGDVATVRKHLSGFTGRHKHLKKLYTVIGRYALDLARREQRLSAQQIRQLKSALK